MQPYFNPLDVKYKSVTGATQRNTVLNISVNASNGEAFFVLVADGGGEKAYPMNYSQGSFFVSVKTEEVGLYAYYFIINGERYGCSDGLLLEKNAQNGFQLVVYDEGYETPRFLTGGIIYQIFPDRFCKLGELPIDAGKRKRLDWGGTPTYRDADGEVRNNEFFGGNFNGVRSKISYLKSLGVTCVYLNPISEAYSSHRYDTGDYLSIDKQLGTVEDLKALLKELSAAGISAVFDGVYNHTGADSVYFNRYGRYPTVGAYSSKKSPYHDWYRFSSFPDEYDSWWGFKNLPSINPYSPFRDFIVNEVIPRYMELGFKGVRLDVVDELPDDFVEEVRRSVKKSDADGIVIGEVWEDATNKIAYGKRRKYFWGNELDSVMNYPLKNAIIDYVLHADTTLIAKTVREQINNYPSIALRNLMNVLSTHDTSRLITVLGRSRVVTDKDLMADEELDEESYEKGRAYAKLAYALAYTLYGVPSLYYGDEAGMTGDLDPYNRRCYPWGGEDADMLGFMRRLGKIRRERSVFKDGETKILLQDRGVFVFERGSGDDALVIAVSREPAGVYLSFNKDAVGIMNGSPKGRRHYLESDSVEIFSFK